MTDRRELAEKLEIIGELFEDERITALLIKIKNGISIIQFNAIVTKVSSLLIKEKPITANKLIASHKGILIEDVEKMEDKEYAKELNDAIKVEVMGFFA